MPLEVLLIRHGQSEWNASGRWQGQQDPPLTDTGRNDARRAAAGLGTFDAVMSSPLLRAAETAAAIAEGIGVGPVLTDDRWMERSAGSWEGLTRSEIEAGWPGYLADGKRPDNWEDDDLLMARAQGALTDLWAEMADAQVAIVTHSGLIMAVERHLGQHSGRMPNLGGRWLRGAGPDRWQLGPRVQLIDAATSSGVLE
ncbi:MAG: histidine phosphatase family protein [Candidatus Microthrix sp.]|uniref:Histidine phosphatase family protein n=1 Tax=Candidatus Neomicrothrix subdominans TaxID=2954438 RepID=A0A936ND51_9ACTN|nr:histidine phosphatase family protein [Candidatus Microthrix subdominans]